jgi:MFS family permease
MERMSFRIHALGLVGLGAMMSIMMTAPVISLYLHARGLSAAHIGAVIGITSAALVVAEVILAVVVSSRIGRRATVAAALVGSAGMLGWFPFIGSLAGLYANRVAFGAIRGLLWPVVFAEVADSSSPDRRGVAFSIFWLYFGVGLLLGPAAGGLLGERFGLQSPFYAAAAISVLTLAGIRAIRPGHDTTVRRPMRSYGVLIRTPAIPVNWMLTVCNVAIFSIYLTFLPLHAAGRGLSPAQIGLIFTAGAVAFIIGQDILRRVGNRVPAERLLVPAFLARGISTAVVPLLPSFGALLVVNFLSSVVTAAIPQALSVRISGLAPRGHLIPAMGAFNASADLGFFIGPVLGGLAAAAGLQWAFLLAIPVTVLALGLLRATSGPGTHDPVENHRSEQDA